MADETWRLWTIPRGHGIPVGRLAMDGDNVFLGFLNNIWPAVGRPQSWCLSLDMSRQFIIPKGPVGERDCHH
jgi:hypothetical protein